MWPEVCRHVGVEPTTELSLRLAALRHRGEQPHQRTARLMREIDHERRVLDRHRRQKQQCSVRG